MPSHRGLQEEVGTLHRELEHTSGKLAEANVQLAAATRQKDHFSSELAARQQKLREVVRASCRRLLQAESFCLLLIMQHTGALLCCAMPFSLVQQSDEMSTLLYTQT